MIPSTEHVLVTGGGGFLGKAIISRLVAKGVRVRSLARSRNGDLDDLGVEQIPGDIRDPGTVAAACKGVNVVFHTAAKAGVWGNPADFYDINVVGTQNILSALKRTPSVRLIHTSSPSVVFNGRDMEGVDESVPYPRAFHAPYPATKAQAEKLVREAARNGLSTLILRPHLIWGPGDHHLIPRILQRGHRLRRVGTGNNRVDTIHIDNAADAHLLASERLAQDPTLSGRIYFISQGEPVLLWDMIDNILKAAGKPPVKGSISKHATWMIGAVLEFFYRTFRIPGEPPMTRFMAEELSTSHWFDIQAARKDLGYAPLISTREGLERLAEHFRP